MTPRRLGDQAEKTLAQLDRLQGRPQAPGPRQLPAVRGAPATPPRRPGQGVPTGIPILDRYLIGRGKQAIRGTEITREANRAKRDIAIGALFGTARAVKEFSEATRLSEVAAYLESKVPLGTPKIPIPRTEAGEFASGAAQVGAGMIPAARLLRGLGAVSSYLRWTAAGAAADALVFDPDDPGLGEFAKELGKLDGPTREAARRIIAEALAKDLDDSELEKRLKNVGGGLALGVGLDGLMVLYRGARGLTKALKARAGAPGQGGDPVQQAGRLDQVLRRFLRESEGQVPPNKPPAPGGNQRPDKGPVPEEVQIKSGVLGEFGDDTRALRQAARKHFDDVLRGTTAINPDLKNISFGGRGRNKVISSSADPRTLKMIPALPDIISRARLIESVPDTRGRAKGGTWHWLETNVVLEGEGLRVGLSVREDANGNFFYNLVADLEGFRTRKGARPDLAPESSGGAPSSGTEAPNKKIISEDGGELNLIILGPPLVPADDRGAIEIDTPVQVAGMGRKVLRAGPGRAAPPSRGRPLPIVPPALSRMTREIAARQNNVGRRQGHI
jgi:hypothetical protein